MSFASHLKSTLQTQLQWNNGTISFTLEDFNSLYSFNHVSLKIVEYS